MYSKKTSVRRLAICFSVQVDKDLKKIAHHFNAEVDAMAYSAFEIYKKKMNDSSLTPMEQMLGLKPPNPKSPKVKEADFQGRIFPEVFAPVIVQKNGKNLIRPMRYRLRPRESSEEVSRKYNLYNARMESLEHRKTWKALFMKNHALFPFKSFFEWVENPFGKKKLLKFSPDGCEIMWAAALYDSWASKDGELLFDSFAVITHGPPKEVEAAGHDRCPAFIQKNDIETWLRAEELNRDRAFSILKKMEPTYFSHVGATL